MFCDDFAELHGVPEDDNGGEQVHAGYPVVLSFRRTVADFASPVEADSPLQRVMRLALVEADLAAALEIDIQNPVDHEQGPLDAIGPLMAVELCMNTDGPDQASSRNNVVIRMLWTRLKS